MIQKGREMKKALFLALACVVCAATHVCALDADLSDLSNTLIYAGENASTINPILNSHEEITSVIFSGLMKYDGHGKPVPDLASAYTYDRATLTYTFTLRKGVKWHDGQDFTADDVLFTYDIITKDKTIASTLTTDYQDIESVSAPAPDTVVIKMSRPNAAMLDYFTLGIVPKHLLQGKDINTDSFNQHPVGTGRYKLTEWDMAGGMIILERNAQYYDKAPNIERVVYRTVAVESTKALMLRSGEADLAWLNAKYAEEFRGRPGFQNIDFTGADYRSASLDFHTDFWKNNADSIAVLNYAVDKEAIVRSVVHGRGVPAYSPIQRNPLGSNKNADIYPFDLARFAREMEALGWKKGADGIYARNGQRFSFTIQVRDYEEERIDVANVASRQLRDAGIEMRVILVTRFDHKAGYNGYLAGFATEFDPDQTFKKNVTGGSDNNMAYSNAEVDELLRQGRYEEDAQKRKEIYGRFEEVYAKVPAHLLFVYLDACYVAINGVRGLNTSRIMGHHARGVMWNIEEWTITR